MAENCNIEYGNRKDISNKEFNNHVNAQNGIPVNQIPVPELVDKFSAIGDKMDALRKSGTKFQSVSEAIDRQTPGAYNKSDFGDFASKAGTIYHEIAEKVIVNMNEGKKNPLEGVKFDDSYHEVWAKQVVKLYKEVFNPTGKNTVLPEVAVGKTDPRVSGIIDVMVITPEKKAIVYDFKSVFSDYKGNMKHGSQVQFYKRMLELGDIDLGMPAIEVESVNIIPIKLESEKQESGGYKVLSHDPDSVKVIDVDKNPELYPNNQQTIVDSRSYLTPDSDVVSNELNSERQNKIVNLNALNEAVIDLQEDSAESKVSALAGTIFQNEDTGKYFYIHNNKEVYFEADVAHRDTKAGRNQRREEIRKNVEKEMKSSESDSSKRRNISIKKGALTDDVVNMINYTNYHPTSVSGPEAKALTDFVENQTQYSHDLHAVRADAIPGLEGVGDDIFILYHGYKAETGKYAKADIIALSNKDGEDNIQSIGSEKFGTNLGANYIKDFQIETLKNKLGLHGLRPLKRTSRNERLIRVGMVAMSLRSNDPETIIGDTSAVNITSTGSTRGKEQDLDTILGNVKLLANIPIDGMSVLEKDQFDSGAKALLQDSSLYDVDNYKENKALSYYHFVTNAINGKNKKKANAYREDMERLKNSTTEEDFFNSLLIGDEEAYRRNLEIIEEDNARKVEAIRTLTARQEDIREYYKNAHGRKNPNTKDFETDPEYKLIVNMILQLNNLRNDLDIASDLNLKQSWVANPGKSGIKLVDGYVEMVKASLRNVSMRYMKEYYPEKVSEFKKFFKNHPKYSNVVVENAIGTHSRLYDDLMEFKKYATKDNPNAINHSRYTGRFWPEGSAEFKALNKDQQDFIKWYKANTISAFKDMENAGKGEEEQEVLNWKDDWIPAMKSDFSNQLFRVWHKGKGSDLTTADAIKAGAARISTMHKNYDEVINLNTDNKTKLLNLFKHQLAPINAEDPSTGHVDLGSTSRMAHYGLEVGTDGNVYAIEDWQDMRETDLERILDANKMNSIRQQELQPLVPLYQSVRAAVSMAASEQGKKFPQLERMLEQWTDMVVHQKNVVMENKTAERGLRFAGMLAGTWALSWNLFSMAKNTVAGFGHTGIQAAVESLASGNTKKLKAYKKAYGTSFKAWLGHRDIDHKMNAIMTDLALGDTDAGALIHDLKFKVGGRNYKMGAAALVQLQDYFHRSQMTAAEMEYDGSIKAYEKIDIDGKNVWRYNEDKDTRFEGTDGEALKTAIKNRMIEEGTLTSLDDRMTIPYTQRELTGMKDKMNLVFEAHNIEAQGPYQAHAIGRLTGSFRKWLVSKTERWTQEGTYSEVAGKWAKTEDAEGNPVYQWEGEYIEGMFQTLKGTAIQLGQVINGGSLSDVATYWDSLSTTQKQNMYRFAIEMAIAAALAALLKSLFDDDDKTFGESMLLASLGELSILDHMSGAGDVVDNPFPQISIISDTVKGMFSENDEIQFRSLLRLTGPGKIAQPFITMFED